MLAEAEARIPREAVFASNTSALPISEIAAGARHPERVIGMHYFSPVPKMPLLEIVVADRTAQWATATARAFGTSQAAILWKHVLKNSMVPIITRVLFSIPLVVISGSLLIETYFGIPGVGRVTFDATSVRSWSTSVGMGDSVAVEYTVMSGSRSGTGSPSSAAPDGARSRSVTRRTTCISAESRRLCRPTYATYQSRLPAKKMNSEMNEYSPLLSLNSTLSYHAAALG